jgi:hypothetical protein
MVVTILFVLSGYYAVVLSHVLYFVFANGIELGIVLATVARPTPIHRIRRAPTHSSRDGQLLSISTICRLPTCVRRAKNGTSVNRHRKPRDPNTVYVFVGDGQDGRRTRSSQLLYRRPSFLTFAFRCTRRPAARGRAGTFQCRPGRASWTRRPSPEACTRTTTAAAPSGPDRPVGSFRK